MHSKANTVVENASKDVDGCVAGKAQAVKGSRECVPQPPNLQGICYASREQRFSCSKARFVNGRSHVGSHVPGLSNI
jgi:hypothetical protein